MLNNKSTPQPDNLSLVFAALADPTRRSILAQLSNGPVTVGDLTTPENISAPALSRHLKVLEKAGLLTREVDAQWRRCRLHAAGLKGAASWIAFYSRFWEDKFTALETYLDETASSKTKQDH